MSAAALSTTDETVKTSRTAGNLNRLSKLQKSILTLAYRHYCDDPRLPHTGVDRARFPCPSFNDIRAGFTWDETWPTFNTLHIYTPEAMANYLGVSFGRARLGSGQWFHLSGEWTGRKWKSVAVDPDRYAVAHAAIYRAFMRLAARGLVKHFRRAAWDGSGVNLTESGLEAARAITGNAVSPRSWETAE